MSARPRKIIADIVVDAARPRGTAFRASPEFAALKGRIWELLRTGQQASLLEPVQP
jgi:hypothetical protein